MSTSASYPVYSCAVMNNDLVFRLWGKTNEREKEKPKWAYHPAICHMVDVGYVADVWLENSSSLRDRFHMLAPGIEPEILRRIIVTVVALHDLGKVHRSFQSKSEEGWKVGYGNDKIERMTDGGKGFDHGRGSLRIMRELSGKEFPEWKPWLRAIDAVAAHHGRLYGTIDFTSFDPTIYPPLRAYDRGMAIEMVRHLCNLFNAPALPVPPNLEGSFLMLLAGFCSVADWFGSNSDVFKFHPVHSSEDIAHYYGMLRDSGRAEQMLREAGLISKFRDTEQSYLTLFDFLKSRDDLRPLQRTAETVPFGVNPGAEMVVVEAPMGIGKTELALYLAAKAIQFGNAGGVYFALPTQASSNAIFDRIESFARRITSGDHEISLALAHGGRRFNEAYRELQVNFRRLQRELERSRENGSAYSEDGSAPSEVVAPAWLQSSKRTLLATIGVGTIDQAMLGAISAKHAFVRLFALAGKVVIFDEIHAYDSYMNIVIVHLLEWLHALGAKVLLLSATLPRGLRNDLTAAYGCKPDDADSDGVLDPYPQMLHVRAGMMTRYLPEELPGVIDPQKVVKLQIIQAEEEHRSDLGARLVLELARRGGCIGWIRNTVREAQEAWRLIGTLAQEAARAGEPPVNVVILHARFIRHDRNRIEEELVEILGKNGGERRPKRLIVIATQVIEQSVDLDFDAMVSDLAPVDLLLQRAGRLWRHERSSETRHGHGEAVLHLLIPSQAELQKLSFGASAYVYDSETLARSAWLAREQSAWTLPGACRELVARLYDRGSEYWTSEHLGADQAKLEQARTRARIVEDTMRGCARRILMPTPEHMKRGMEYAYSDDDRGGNVALTTRYGGASATVVLLAERGGEPYPLGAPGIDLRRLPSPDDFRQTLALEEAIALSSVSFPWYDRLDGSDVPESIQPLAAWWRDRHPYDNKIFLLLGHDDVIDHPQFTGRYPHDGSGDATEGLVIERKRIAKERDIITYEDL